MCFVSLYLWMGSLGTGEYTMPNVANTEYQYVLKVVEIGMKWGDTFVAERRGTGHHHLLLHLHPTSMWGSLFFHCRRRPRRRCLGRCCCCCYFHWILIFHFLHITIISMCIMGEYWNPIRRWPFPRIDDSGRRFYSPFNYSDDGCTAGWSWLVW